MFFWILFFVVVTQGLGTRYTCNNTYQFFDGTSEKVFSLQDVVVPEYDGKDSSHRIKYGTDWVAAKFFCDFFHDRGIGCTFEQDPMLTKNNLLFESELKQVARLIEKLRPFLHRLYDLDPVTGQSRLTIWRRKETCAPNEDRSPEDELKITQVCSM